MNNKKIYKKNIKAENRNDDNSEEADGDVGDDADDWKQQ